MNIILPFVVIFFVTSSTLAKNGIKDETNHEKLNLRNIVKEVNEDGSNLWKADTYGFDEINIVDAERKLGTNIPKNDESISKKSSKSSTHQNEEKLGVGAGLPRFYDARKRYPECNSISHIRDQSYCGSCWAVSGVSVLSDRLCIHSKGRYNFELSSRFVLSCEKRSSGCRGGYLNYLWEFLEKNGTVTGGDFQSDVGCQDYPLHPCGWPKKLACPWYITPKCLKNKCDNELYKYSHEKHTFKARTSYAVNDGLLGILNEYYIQKEIYENGPVQAAFYVFSDFLTYKSGIYHLTKGRLLGGHAVKIIGWGEEKGVKYWIIANSWGEDWGENGTFRMIRGEDDCGIETKVWAGIPAL